MRTVKELDPSLAILADCYKWQDDILEVEMPEDYIEAREHIKAAIRLCDPESLNNRTSISEISKAIKLFDEALDLYQDESIETALSYAYALRSCIYKNQGDWLKAENDARKAVKYSDIGGMETTYTHYGKAGAWTILAQIEVIQNNIKGAIIAYEKSVTQLEPLSHWFNNQQDLGCIHLLQRQYNILSDLYFLQHDFYKAFDYARKSIQLAGKKQVKNLYQNLVSIMPELKALAEEIKTSETNDIYEIISRLELARWLSLLMLDRPDLDEIRALFIRQYKLLFRALYQHQKAPFSLNLSQAQLEKLFLMYEAILNSEFYGQIKKENKRPGKVRELMGVYEQIRDDYKARRKALEPGVSDKEAEKPDLNKFAAGIKEQGLVNKCKSLSDLYCRLFNSNEIHQAIAAMEEVVQDNIRLINMANDPLALKEYRLDYFRNLMFLADDYSTVGKLKKALDCYRKAEKWLEFIEEDWKAQDPGWLKDPREGLFHRIEETNYELEQFQRPQQPY